MGNQEMPQADQAPEKEEEFTHPEMRNDEVLLCNTFSENFGKPFITRYKTFRIGNVPYDDDGKPMKTDDLRPVFVKKSEYDELDGKK